MKLLVATTNPNKLREIRPLLADLPIELVTLAEVPPVPEPEEDGATFWENARLKALAYAATTGLTTVAEDSGFEIAALGGLPGVHSARFLGRGATYPDRFAEIYRQLDARGATTNAEARFVTALAVARGRKLLFETETVISGLVAPAPAGDRGFGYDPIFWYPPLRRTTAELTDAEKASVSHRGRAFRDLRRWLRAAGAR
jgi:XTP/dITP diphosphohydrolase